MAPGEVFFEVPVYRIKQDEYYSAREKFVEEYISMIYPTKEDRDRLEKDRDRVVTLTDHAETSYGGPWIYNEAIGFIRLHFLGSQIRGEYFGVRAKKITKTRRKQFEYKTYKVAPEITIPREASNAEIWSFVQEYLRDSARSLKGRHIDTEAIEVIGPFVDWRALILSGR